jgi:integrase
LTIAKKPYYRALDEGLHLGYRKSQSGTAWVVRWYKGEGAYQTENLDGRPDDVLTADGATVLNWSQAQGAARTFFERKQRAAHGLEEIKAGPYRVADAMADYLAAYRRRGGKAVYRTEVVINALILPELGAVSLSKLTHRRIETWHEKLAETPVRMTTKRGEPQRYQVPDESPEGKRRRRSSANRTLTVLKAALNHAYQERRVESDEGWRRVKPFRAADAARVRYLSDDEARRLVNGCGEGFRPLVQAALLTGCRYSELTRLTVADFNIDAGTLHIRISKSGKPRHVVLTDEGRSFFASSVAGKCSDALIFTKPDGKEWGDGEQKRPISYATEAADMPKVVFHELRHTYASRLVMKGVPLAVVAAQLGHSGTQMVEKHYGHMALSYIADTVRAAFTRLDIVKPTNVVPLSAGGQSA